MPKKRRRGRHHHEPRRPTVERRHVDPVVGAEDQPLIQGLRRSLHEDHPLAFLEHVSGLTAVTEPRTSFGADDGPRVSLADIVESFTEIDLAETTAALAVIARLTTDEVQAASIRRTLSGRRQPLPPWLTDLDLARATRVDEMREVQRDGENYVVEVDLPAGHVMCAVVYVDNNLGGIVKDAFLIPESLDTYRAFATSHMEQDQTLAPVDGALARAIVEQAIEIGTITIPPAESDTWPGVRPLVRWIVSLLPTGGEVPQPREWSDAELAELTEAFLGSPQGRPYDDAEHRSLLEDLLWFGVSQGTGDPLRWTPVNVEIVLADWYPRKVVGEPALLTKLPGLLRAFVDYCHHRTGLRRELTVETLQSVDRWEPDFQRLIRTARPQGAEALARLLIDADRDWSPTSHLEEAVGGRSELMRLTADPLPDEEFEWAGIPDDIHEKVAEILALCDANAAELLDVEHRTANRRLLSRVAVADPGFFRGRAAARTSAAAISWMIAHANDSISPYGLTAAELLAPFGVTSASQRAHRFRKALGLGEHLPGDPMALEAADLLVSARRAEIIEERDRLV